jgi:hypothetical protein
MTVFELASYVEGSSWTAVTDARGRRLFGEVAATYAVAPAGPGTRLVARLAFGAGGPARRVWAELLAWGDLVMMRRQLLNLKGLAERDAREPTG